MLEELLTAAIDSGKYSEATVSRPVVIRKSRYFDVTRDADSLTIDMTQNHHHGDMRNSIFNAMRRSGAMNFAIDCHHRYALKALARYYDAIYREFEENGHLANADGDYLIKLLAEQAEILKQEMTERIGFGKLAPSDVNIYFTKGMEVYEKGESPIAGIVESVDVVQAMFASYFRITISVLHGAAGRGLSEGKTELRMKLFDEDIDIAELPIQRLDEGTKVKLIERGRRVQRFLTTDAYARYTGTVVQPSWAGARRYRAHGRIMVDARVMRQMEASRFRDAQRALGLQFDQDEDDFGDTKIVTEYPEDQLWRAMPHLFGFSFAAKQWGLVDVADMHPIEWNSEAFDRLVLPEEDKKLVRALVEYHGESFGDIIDGKGGGSIFLLHGEPGQGKTLTAEAVAELLHRPLYAISVGELGTSPNGLEKSLREILDLAMTWNAVILLDEADIFLEARDEQDIVRNAMVGVFLRLLEYHQGVMFLTTNRVRNIDRAFYSRISVALRFDGASRAKREAIWHNLLAAAGLHSAWAVSLSTHDLNGRQIKNAIRQSQTLARSEGSPVEIGHVKRAISAMVGFQHYMDKSSD